MFPLKLSNGTVLQFRSQATRDACVALVNRLWWNEYAWRWRQRPDYYTVHFGS